MGEWAKSERRLQILQAKRRAKACLFFVSEPPHFAPPEGSADVAVFRSRNHE